MFHPEGITGRVTFDENGDRVPVFIIDNIQNNKFVAMKYFDADANSTSDLNGTFTFPGGATVPPRDIPLCGFNGELCPKGNTILRLFSYNRCRSAERLQGQIASGPEPIIL